MRNDRSTWGILERYRGIKLGCYLPPRTRGIVEPGASWSVTEACFKRLPIFLKYMPLAILFMALVGCGMPEIVEPDVTVDNIEIQLEDITCTVEPTLGGVLLICPGNEPVFIENGQDGLDGEDGLDGQDGIDGADGEDGIDGEQGPAGINCIVFCIDSKYIQIQCADSSVIFRSSQCRDEQVMSDKG